MFVSRSAWTLVRAAFVIVVFFLLAGAASAAEWFVAVGGTGAGSSAAPFGSIQAALKVAQPGDIITLRPGAYTQTIRTVRSGASGKPIVIRAATERGTVMVTAPGRVLTVAHAYITVEGLIFDGQYGDGDTVKVETAGSYLMFRNNEVRRSKRDLIDLVGPTAVTIEQCLLHRALNATGGRTDAHGIAAGPVQKLTIRNTEIHTFSGDGFQVDPDRSAPGWKDVLLEDVRFWLAPLAAPENGFAAGVVPGENAVDTKASGSLPRATLTMRNVSAWGFRAGLIGNMAAFNLKEHISATLDRITVYDSEIAFRLRGGGSATTGAWVTLMNAVVYNVATGYRYENDIQNLRIWNNTLGASVGRAFDAASSSKTGLNVRNLLVLGTRPAEASDPSNLGVNSSSFVNASRGDYRLATGSPAIDTGARLSTVLLDRDGVKRPVGSTHDVGAFEWQPPDPGEVVAYARDASAVAGAWLVVADTGAAGGARMTHPDKGAAAIGSPSKTPAHYFDLSVNVQAGRAYRLWVRGKADKNLAQNDSVYVQFSGAVTASGSSLYAIGSTSAAVVSIEDCVGCGLSNWGWQDNGPGVETLGPLVYFATSGTKTIRIQTREDGVSIDQVVLSPVAYRTASPGRLKNDTVIVAEP